MKDPRLLGSWRSDRERTVAEWRFSKRLTPEKRRRFLEIFGKLRLTYTASRIRGSLDGYWYTQPYEVVAVDADSAAIRYEDRLLTRQWRSLHVHFEGRNRYWISLGRNREWFRRVRVKTAGTKSWRQGLRPLPSFAESVAVAPSPAQRVSRSRTKVTPP